MFNVGKLSTLLDSIDSAANKTIHADDEEELPSVTRSKRRGDGGETATIVATSEETERLHAECLDLEKQVESLTDEVKRAWGAYKGLQEKSVAHETELAEEISSLETAKASEIASLNAEVAQLREDVEVYRNRFELLLSENKKVVQQYEELRIQSEIFGEKEKIIMEELEEARACSSSNAAVMREQLIVAEAAMETMRADHAAWMLQSHKRQEQLEQSNAELANSLTESQRKIIKLKTGGDHSERFQASTKEVEELRKIVGDMTASREELTDKYNEQVRQMQAREREMRTAQLLWEDERKRNSEVTSKYAADLEDFRNEIMKLKLESKNDAILGNTSSKKNELEEQIKTLSQQLLKKQTNVQELLVERSALKVRVQDLTMRCEKAEEQANTLMYNDFEGNGVDNIDDDSYSYGQSSSTSSSRVLRRKGGTRHSVDTYNSRDLKSDISSDLENNYGVKTAPAIARAVDTLDTWAQLTGRYLRIYPIMRLAFCLYLLFLHLWAFVVLIFHAHTLEHDAFAPPKHPQ